MKKLKILISAHELSPYLGSECGNGWNIISRLGKYHNLIVLYAEKNHFGNNNYSTHIKKFIQSEGEINGIKFISISQSKLSLFLASLNKRFFNNQSIGFPPIYYLAYRLWQKKAYRLAKKICLEEQIDIIHHITSINFREPGYLWKLSYPFVWGPTGGMGNQLPVNFFSIMKTKTKILEIVRYISDKLNFILSSRIRGVIRKSSMIYIFTKEDEKLLAKRKDKSALTIMLDAGTTDNKTINQCKHDKSKLQIIWVGQLIDRKAPEILIRSLSLLANEMDEISVTIIGDGYLRGPLMQLAKSLNLNNLNWIQNVEHEKIFSLMSEADVLVHTSYREATSTVIPEALSSGLPVICHDVHGMGIAVNDKCGITIPCLSPNKSIVGFKEAILRIKNEPQLLISLKKGARERAQELSWEMMVNQISRDYYKVLINENTTNK